MSFRASTTTASLGGSLLTIGATASLTVAVSGARAGMLVAVTPNADPGVGCIWYGFVSANDVVTVRLLAIISLTPVSTTYSVVVEQ
jgi:hypothetical protein